MRALAFTVQEVPDAPEHVWDSILMDALQAPFVIWPLPVPRSVRRLAAPLIETTAWRAASLVSGRQVWERVNVSNPEHPSDLSAASPSAETEADDPV